MGNAFSVSTPGFADINIQMYRTVSMFQKRITAKDPFLYYNSILTLTPPFSTGLITLREVPEDKSFSRIRWSLWFPPTADLANLSSDFSPIQAFSSLDLV